PRATNCSCCSGVFTASTCGATGGRGGAMGFAPVESSAESMLTGTTARIPLSKRTDASRAALRNSATCPRPHNGWLTMEPIILIFAALRAAQLVSDLSHDALHALRLVQTLALGALLGQHVNQRFDEVSPVARREQRRASLRQLSDVLRLQLVIELHAISQLQNPEQLLADPPQQLIARIIELVEADLDAERVLARELHFRADALAERLVLRSDVGDEVGRHGVGEERRGQAVTGAAVNHFAKVVARDFFGA